MTSFALDFVTIGHALNTLLDQKQIGAAGWKPCNADQGIFLHWYEQNRGTIATLSDLKALASENPDELNAFLTDDGFAPKYDKTMDGIGVVSILDMLVEWLEEAKVTTIGVYKSAETQHNPSRPVCQAVYPAIQLKAGNCHVYDVTLNPLLASTYPLLQLHTKTGHSLWLQRVNDKSKPQSGIDLAEQASYLATKQFKPNYNYGGCIVPMLDMDLDTSLDWLVGLSTKPDWYVGQASQQFKLRLNEKGARVKVATSLLVTRGFTPEPVPYVMSGPFIGWFTQPGHDDLPLAAFYADFDSWRQPAGSLEDL